MKPGNDKVKSPQAPDLGDLDLSDSTDLITPEAVEEIDDAIWDVDLHEEAMEIRKAGLWFDFGPLFGHAVLRIRPFWVEAVQVKRAEVERQMRIKEGIRDSEETPERFGVPLNRVTALMAITGARVKARIGGELVELTESDPPEKIRSVLKPRIDASMPFLLAIIDRNKEMKRKHDQEVVKLGEGFVYGRPEKLGWGD